MKTRPLEIYLIEYTEYVLNTQSKKNARYVVDVIQEFLDSIPSLGTPDEVYLSERDGYLRSLELRGLSPKSIEWYRTALRAFWNWMKRKEYAKFNPFRNLNPTI